jgi:hypothetical protein
MHHPITRHTRTLLTTLTIIIIAATTITAAHANRLAHSDNAMRVAWDGLQLGNSFTETFNRCAVTLEGSFHSRTIVKVREKLIGYITRGGFQNNQCTGGRTSVLSETLPWHITYQSFGGTLPRIESVLLNLIRSGFGAEFITNSCKVITTITSPLRVITNVNTVTGTVEGMRVDETARIPGSNGPGGMFCNFGSWRFSGRVGTVTSLGTANAISITLI